MAPFTASSNSSSGVSKALLPVANKPLIQYAIEWCQKVSFKSRYKCIERDLLSPFLSARFGLGLGKVADTYRNSYCNNHIDSAGSEEICG